MLADSHVKTDLRFNSIWLVLTLALQSSLASLLTQAVLPSSRVVLCNEMSMSGAEFISDGLLIGFVKPKKTVYKDPLPLQIQYQWNMHFLPVKKDNINKHFQEPLLW